MADTDVLRIPVDTRQVDRGTTALNRLDQSGSNLDETISDLNRQVEDGAESIENLGGASTTAGRALRDMDRQVDGSIESIEDLGGVVNDVSQIMRLLESGVNVLGLSLRRLASSIVLFLAIEKIIDAIIGGIKKSISEFRAFEKGLVNVAKTTGLAGDELDKFSDGLARIVLSMPVTTADLLSIAEAAGQLGIKGSRDLLKFSEVIVKLGSASNIGGSEAATALARIFTITGENIDQAERFASQVVALGNAFVTNERDIVSISEAVARATTTFKIGSGAVAAISATMSEVAISTELAGSVVLRVFIKISEAIREEGKSLESLSKITGKTGEELIKTFGKSNLEVFNQFLRGLKRIDEEGSSVIKTLKDFGLVDRQLLSTIPTLALAFETLSDAYATVEKEQKNITAIHEEYSRILVTFNTEMVLLGNTFDEVATKIGSFIVELFRLKEISKFVRDSLVSIFELPRSATLIREEMEAIQKLIDKGQKAESLTILFGGGDLAHELAILEKELKSLEGASSDVERTTEKLNNKTKSLNGTFEKSFEGLNFINPKMTAFALEQISLTKAQDESNKSLRMQIRQIGLTKNELQDLSITRAIEAIEIAKTNNSSEAYLKSLENQTTLLRQRKTVSRAFEAERKALEKNKSLLSEIEDKSRTIFNAFFDSGKSAFEELNKILKETLIETLFKLTVKKWIIDIGSRITGETLSVKSAGSDVLSGIISTGISAAISAGSAAIFGTSAAAGTAAAGTGAGAAGAGAGAAGAGAAVAAGAAGAAVAAAAAAAAAFFLGREVGKIVGGSDLINTILGFRLFGVFGGLGALFGKKKRQKSPKLAGRVTLTEAGEFVSRIDTRRISPAGVEFGEKLLQAQLTDFQKLIESARLNFSDITQDVLVLRTQLISGDAEEITKQLFFDFGRLISEGVLEGVPPALARALEEASGGKEIQKAVESWLNARNSVENTLKGIIKLSEDLPPVELALIALNKQFADLSLQSKDLGVDLELIGKAYEASVSKIQRDFVDEIESEIRRLTDPNGAALLDLRKWRKSVTKEVSLIGTGSFQVEKLFQIKRLNITKSITTEALSDLSKAIEKEKGIISQAANDISFSMVGLTDTLNTLQESLIAIQGVSKISSFIGIDAAMSVLDAALEFSKSGGRLADFSGFADALTTITKVDERLFGSAVDFRRVLGQSEALISSLIGETETQISVEEMSLEEITSAVDRLDEILVESENAVNILLGIYNTIKSVPAALAELGDIILKAGGKFDVSPSFDSGTNVIQFSDFQNNRDIGKKKDDESDVAKEVRGLREDLISLGTAMTLNVFKIRRTVERQDTEGLPPERIPA